jgi:2OG-Fe(II) oxygenase superfamily
LKWLKDTSALYSRMESLTCQPLDNGNSAYFPNFCSELLLDADVLYDDLVKANLFLPRDASFMKYRGKPIKRSKFFINMTGDPGVLAKYSYPGFQYAAMPHYLEDDAIPILKPLMQKLPELGMVFTQAIGTLYETGQDNIGWHSDKQRDIHKNSQILDISLGSERTFLLRNEATGMQEKVVMKAGSAILLSTDTNERCKHAVLPEVRAGARISLVFRHIKTTITAKELEAKLRKKPRHV